MKKTSSIRTETGTDLMEERELLTASMSNMQGPTSNMQGLPRGGEASPSAP